MQTLLPYLIRYRRRKAPNNLSHCEVRQCKLRYTTQATVTLSYSQYWPNDDVPSNVGLDLLVRLVALEGSMPV